MQNNINYISHKLYTPDFYHRQFKHDLPENKEDPSNFEQAKRVVHIALPFISLYKPAGAILSQTMGSIRVLSNGMELLNADRLDKTAYATLQLGLATIALIGTFYQFTIGLYVTTLADLATNLIHIAQDLASGHYSEAIEEMLGAATSALYLGIFITGSLEIVLASILMQAITSFYQSRSEWEDGRVPEALAKTLMGFIRLYQAKGQIDLIQRRKALLKRYHQMAERIQNGRKIDHLWDHPLVFLAAAIDEKNVILTDGNGDEYELGAHFHGLGRQTVKGMNIVLRQEDGKNVLEFKVNHVFRDRLEALIQKTKKTKQNDLQDLLQILGSKIEKISIEKTPVLLESWSGLSSEEYKITLKGLGTINIGSFEQTPNLYDKIQVKMDSGKNLYDFHEALSFFQLDDALRSSAEEDITRLKIGQLFRIFSPHEATLFERSAPFFDLPLEKFQEEILRLDPKMKDVIETYLPRMEIREILPGRMRYVVNGLAEELQEKGALGLTAILTGTWTEKALRERVASILKMGLISAEMKEQMGFNKNGYGADHFVGAADSVFTQLITDKNEEYDEFWYEGSVRFVFSPKLLETGTYQYHEDNNGNRIDHSPWWEENYLDRENIVDFLKEERKDFGSENEVMIKERIPPEYITGIILRDETFKKQLIDDLRAREIFQIDASGNETIFSKKIEDFFQVENKIKQEHFV